MKQQKITINKAKSAGFCFGVKRALSIAQDKANSGKKVYMLGDIVHNEEVVKKIEKSGIKKIKSLGKGQGKTLLIRAHGSSKTNIQKAKNHGYKITDATCPMVKEIHKTARDMEKKGFQIIIIGDKNHDEVKGIAGQLKNKALILSVKEKLPQTINKIKKAAVVVQSTQNIEKVKPVVEKLKSCIENLRFFNTICNPTRIKQKEIHKLPLENDIVIVIGSKRSANTKRLYEIAYSLNKNSFWVQSKKNLKPEWFKNVKTVGITAGASTPDETTNDVIEYIKELDN